LGAISAAVVEMGAAVELEECQQGGTLSKACEKYLEGAAVTSVPVLVEPTGATVGTEPRPDLFLFNTVESLFIYLFRPLGFSTSPGVGGAVGSLILRIQQEVRCEAQLIKSSSRSANQ